MSCTYSPVWFPGGWHIAFSNWLRDYIFYSLPGKRSQVMPYINLVVTMLLGGLWHGVSWNFATWGLLHGSAVAFVHGWRAVGDLRHDAGSVRFFTPSLRSGAGH
jgi:D-alanyl-lipoteichoic acid acyltransferase DltB (MBOAT superfamily)